MSTIPSNIDSGSAEAIARDKIAERGFADTLRELETLKRTDRESRDEWLKSWGFGLFAVLKHGPIGEVLSLLQDGWISRGKAAEAMAEIMLGNKPNLPENKSSAFDDLDIPGDVVNTLRRCAFELSNDKDMALGKLDQALTERDTARAEAAMLREALKQADDAFEKIHDDWAEPSASAAGGQIANICLIASLSIDTALSGSSGEWLERQLAEARRKALMEVYERVKNLRGCNAYDVIDSIEEMAKETTNG